MSIAETLAARAKAKAEAAEGGIVTEQHHTAPVQPVDPAVAAAKEAADKLARVADLAAKHAELTAEPEELQDRHHKALAEKYPEGSYLMLTQKVLLLPSGGKIKPDANGVITAADDVQLSMLKHWDSRNSGLVKKLK